MHGVQYICRVVLYTFEKPLNEWNGNIMRDAPEDWNGD